MKQTVIKLFAAIAFMIGFTTTIFAQTNITASANVVTAVSVVAGENLQFGNVTPGNSKTINSADGVIQGIIAGTTEKTGTYTVNKGANSQVSLSFTLPTNLVGVTPANTLPINFTDYNSTKLGAIGSVLWSPSASVVVTNATYPIAFAASSFVVHVGGTVVPGASQAADSYSGTITMTATYN